MIAIKQYVIMTFGMSVKEKIRSFLTRNASTRIFLFLQDENSIQPLADKKNPEYGNDLVKLCYDEMGKNKTFFNKLWIDFINELSTDEAQGKLLDLYRFAAFYSKNPNATSVPPASQAWQWDESLKLYFAEILSVLWLTGNEGNSKYLGSQSSKNPNIQSYWNSFPKTFVPDNLVGWFVGHPKDQAWFEGVPKWEAPLFNFEHPYAFGEAPQPPEEKSGLPAMYDEKGDLIGPNPGAGKTALFQPLPPFASSGQAHRWWDLIDTAKVSVYDTRKCAQGNAQNAPLCKKNVDPDPRAALYDMKAFNFDGKSLYRWPSAGAQSAQGTKGGSLVKCDYPGDDHQRPYYVYQVLPRGNSTPANGCWPLGIRAANFSYVRWEEIIKGGYWLEYFFRVKNIPLFKDNWPTPFYSEYLSFREFALLMKTIMDFASGPENWNRFFDAAGKPYSSMSSPDLINTIAEQLDVYYGVRLVASIPDMAKQTTKPAQISKTYNDIKSPHKIATNNWDGHVHLINKYDDQGSPKKESYSPMGWKNNNPAPGAFVNKTYLYNFLEGRAVSSQQGSHTNVYVDWHTTHHNVLTLAEQAERITTSEIKTMMGNMSDYYTAPSKYSNLLANDSTLRWYMDQEIDRTIVKEYSENMLDFLDDDVDASAFIKGVAHNLGKPVISADPNYYDKEVIDQLKKKSVDISYYDEDNDKQKSFSENVKKQVDKTIDNNLKIAINKLLEGTD